MSQKPMVVPLPQIANVSLHRLSSLYCAICHSIINPYVGGKTKKEGEGESMCDSCVSNIQFTQDSSTHEDV
jgi:hypothetical protein